MELTGIIKRIGTTEVVSDKFKKREVVITLPDDKYPQHISFQLIQDKVELVSTCKVGDEIKVQFNIRGREWISPLQEVKYFNSLEIWKLDAVSSGNNITNEEIEAMNSFNPIDQLDKSADLLF